jgi:glycosyltransferase involved in cell wall biosynthesis
MEDLVSIITPMYNGEAFFPGTARSVLGQTWGNWEWIIVDDGSEDRSLALAQKEAGKDPRVRVASLDSNMGPAEARNRAIDMAKGKFIAFLDSDDLWKPEKLEKQVGFMLEGGISFSYSYYEVIEEAGAPLDRTVRPPLKLTYSDMLRKNHIGCLTAMYDASALGKMYMPLLRKRQDYGLWLDILKRVEFAHCLPEALAVYRLRGSSISSNKMDLAKYNWKLFREVEGLPFFSSLRCLLWNIGYRMLDGARSGSMQEATTEGGKRS